LCLISWKKDAFTDLSRLFALSSSHQWGDNWNLEDLSLWSPDDTDAGKPKEGQATVEAVAPNDTSIAKPDFSRSSSTRELTSPSQSSGLESIAGSSGTLKRPLEQRFALDRDVLTNGARAVGAFSRPFPVATFGVPKRADFDIKSSKFKLVLEVSPGDVMDESAPTEIYLPWVHYASDAGFSTEFSAPPTVFKGDASTSAPRPSTAGSSLSSRSRSPHISLSKVPKESTVRVEDLSASTSSGSTLANDSPTTAILPPFELDLDVDVSAGRYEIQGQTLRWWYHSAPGANAKRVTTYTLTVKRRGGARREMVRPLGETSHMWNVSDWLRWMSAFPFSRRKRGKQETDPVVLSVLQVRALFISWLASLWALFKSISKPHRQKKYDLQDGEEGKATRRLGR
jgi:hypothetical protein